KIRKLSESPASVCLDDVADQKTTAVGSCDSFRRRQGKASAHGRARVRRRLDDEAAAGELGALAHAQQPQTGTRPLDAEANPVITDRDLQDKVLRSQGYFDVARARVPSNVAQCLLHDAEASRLNLNRGARV